MVTCQNLIKRYGRVVALDGVTLSMEHGVVGLLGPNGAGKTTLISILLGQTPATSGGGAVLGLDIRRQQHRIRQRMGFMPENDCIIAGLTGVGFVVYAGRLSGMPRCDAIQRAHEVLDYVGFDEARYRPAAQYSTGLRQRLKLAQALIHDPEILFLDEPTNGMDPEGRDLMLALITDLGRAGVGIVLSSHLLPDVERVCQRVVIMARGRVAGSGPIAEMREPHPTLCRIEYIGDGAELHRSLLEKQVAVLEHTAGSAALRLPEPGSHRLILEAAAQTHTRLRGLHPRRSSLEETFLQALEKPPQP